MATRLGKFELPNRLIKEEETANDKYAKFIADPFESGYGHTIGNAFRRSALTSPKISPEFRKFSPDFSKNQP